MHKTDPVLNFTYVAMNGTRKKCQTYSIIICLTRDLVFLYILNRDLKGKVIGLLYRDVRDLYIYIAFDVKNIV